MKEWEHTLDKDRYDRWVAIANTDFEVLKAKNAPEEYGDSWCRRGGIGAFMMVARKWDRLENVAKEVGWDIFAAAEKDCRPEGVLDDIRDLRRYLILIEEYVTREGEGTVMEVNAGGDKERRYIKIKP